MTRLREHKPIDLHLQFLVVELHSEKVKNTSGCFVIPLIGNW